MPKWLLDLIHILFPLVSGPLREQIIEAVNKWEKAAKETSNPWDDILVGLVKWLLAIP